MSAPAPIRRTVGRAVLIASAEARPESSPQHSHVAGMHIDHRSGRRIISTSCGSAFNLATGEQFPSGPARFIFAD